MFNSRRLERIEISLRSLEVATGVVRDPDSTRTADAFDGLRKSIVDSRQAKRAHQGHLLALYDSIQRDASYELIKERVSDYLQDVGVQWLTDCADLDFFEIIETEGFGDVEEFICVKPAAYEVLENGRRVVIRMGEVRCVRTERAKEVSSESDAIDVGGLFMKFLKLFRKKPPENNDHSEDANTSTEVVSEVIEVEEDKEEGTNLDPQETGEES